jgi:hypothetical protein
MKDEIKLVDIELYKKDPSILQDIAYLRHNLEELSNHGLKYMDFPENIRKNPIFVAEYFSKIEANKKEYKHIPSELLKDQFFVSSCLMKNPDIYLLADPSCHTEFAFKTLSRHHSSKYLKYAKEIDLNNKEFCKQALNINVTNFQYMPEEFRADKEIIMHHLYDRFWKSDKPGRAEIIGRNIPEYVFEDKKFVENILDKNIYIFRELPNIYKENESIAYKAVCEDSANFASVDIKLKQNKNFVNKLLEHGKNFKSNSFSNIYNHRFHSTEIIMELDESYFTRDFCEKNSAEIRNTYTALNKKIRGNIEVIRSIYLFDSEGQIEGELYQSIFLNKIPNEALVREIKDFVAGNSRSELFEINSGPLKLIKLIETFELRKELNTELTSNAQLTKKMKL